MKKVFGKFGKIEIGVEEKFFYDPDEIITNLCTMCGDFKKCPVTCKNIVISCNSYEFTAQVSAENIATQWRVTQGFVISSPGFAYLNNVAS